MSTGPVSGVESKPDSHYGPVDIQQLRLLGQLPPARRVRAMLEAQVLLFSAIRGRLRRRYPDLSSAQINLKLFEEFARYAR